MQVFEVTELNEFPYMETREMIQGQIVGNIINENNLERVFLLIDHDTKRIWTYNGPNSSFKLQIYGGILAGMLRQQLRLFYRIYPLNKYSKDDPEFQEILKKPITGGRAKSIQKRDFPEQEIEVHEKKGRRLIKGMKDLKKIIDDLQKQNIEIMYCENCGAVLQKPNQSFCQNCGSPLRVKILKYNDKLAEFQELELEEDIQIQELLDPDFILLFVDFKGHRVWIWHGSNTTTRMKFIASKLAPSIRDRYGIGFKIAAVDEGNEPLGFKIMIGLKEEPNDKKAQIGPTYEGTEEDLELFESLSKNKIHLLHEALSKELEKNRKEKIKIGIEKIESVMKKESINELTIDRKYLPEIFNADLLEISKDDGLPILKPFVLEYFNLKRILTELHGNVIKFKKLKKKII